MALPETPQQQLEWEARHRPRATLAAAFAAVAIVVGPLVESAIEAGAPSLPVLDALQKLAAPGTIYDQPTLQVPYGHYIADHAAELIAGRFVMGDRVHRAHLRGDVPRRRHPRPPARVRPLGLLPADRRRRAVRGLVGRAGRRARDRRHTRSSTAPARSARCRTSATTGLSQLSRVLLTPAALVLAVGIVLVSLNAMRAGLLTRFMGALGIVVGVFQVVQVGSSLPLVQTFWLGGLALLFAGRRPGGDPPAWRTGRAEPWPSGRQLAEQRKAAGRGARPRPARQPRRPPPQNRSACPPARTRRPPSASASAAPDSARGARRRRKGYHSPQHCRFS